MLQVSHFAERLVNRPAFEYIIIALIVGNGVLLGLETFPTLDQRYGSLLHLGNQIVLGSVHRGGAVEDARGRAPH